MRKPFPHITTILFAAVIVCGLCSPILAADYDAALADTAPFYPDGEYDATVPDINDYLAHPIGWLPLRYHELAAYLKILDGATDRVRVEKHARTHEGRDLFNVIISSSENMAKLDDIRRQISDLADPRSGLTAAERANLAETLPAVAWMGYNIHGGELSGADAAARLIYQLAAGTDAATRHLLDNVIVIIDPIQNPDGRERYMTMLQTYRSDVPNYDHSSMQHQGVWPYGRTNHYLFDLNRDWILATQPETIGKLSTLTAWHPQLIVDGHEMGPNATFLFDPPREPINYNTSDNVRKWWQRFSTDQAAAFDRHGWPYYIEEWHDQWYPGYGSAWGTFSGSIGILYEQARVDGEGIVQRDDYFLTYHEAVNHHFTSSMANLRTLADNRVEILKDYVAARKAIVDEGRRSAMTFLLVPDEDAMRTERLVTSLLRQGIEVSRATEGFNATKVTDVFGEEHNSRRFPTGTFIVSTAQPMGALAKAVLEFDPHLGLDFLKEERRELEKEGDTRMYEVSTWSLPLAYNADAFVTGSSVTVGKEPVTLPLPASAGELINPDAGFGFLVRMSGERVHRLLVKLFGEHLIVYCSEDPFKMDGIDYPSGTLLLRRRGNPDDMPETLHRLAAEIGLTIRGVNTAQTSEGSYLGASSFRLLAAPKIGILAGEGIDYTSFGALWYVLDQELAVDHALINASSLARSDLSKFNTIVMPGVWGGPDRVLGQGGKSKLGKWVRDGGTLITTGSSTPWAADTATGWSKVRQRRQVLDELDEYDASLRREIAAEAPEIDTMALWHPDKVPPQEGADAIEKAAPAGKADPKQDEWARRFHPRGVFLKAEVDRESWLTFAMDETVPVMLYTDYALLSQPPVSTVARLTSDKNSLRLSGLLWPEARKRWAGSAIATRERMGSGQLIMFAAEPYLRAYMWGTRRMFVNAVMFGAGMGTNSSPYEEEQ